VKEIYWTKVKKKRLRVITELRTIKNEKLRVRKKKKRTALLKHLKEKDEIDQAKQRSTKRHRKEVFRIAGLMTKNEEEGPRKKRRLNK